jgi:PAS domain S-box-containing protein
MKEIERLRKLLEEEKQKNFLLDRELQLKEVELKTLQKNTEDTFRIVVESADDIIFKTDLNGFFTYVNPAAAKIIGYPVSEFVGIYFLDIIREDYRPEILQAYTNQLKSRLGNVYTEFPVIKKDGSIFWVGQNVQLIYKDDNVIGYSAIARDITQRIRSQEQLNLVNTRLESIFNNLNLGLLLEDSDRRVILTNAKFCELFNYDIHPDEMVGLDCKAGLEKIIDYFVDGRTQIDKLKKCVEDKVICLKQEVKLSDGRIFEWDYIPIFVEKKYIGHLWKYKDITEEMSAQQLLANSEEKYRQIIQNMNLGLLVVDNFEMIVDVNPSFCDMTGFSREELLGKSAVNVLLPKEKRGVVDDAINLRKKGISNAYEVEVKNKFGEHMWMLISGSPIFDAQKKIVGSIGIHLDITDSKKQFEELTEARQKAESSARSKELFLANMSHEIRTPMNAIVGMAKLLDEAKLSYKHKEYLEAIKSSSENLLVIINDILDFSKIDQGKLVLENSTFSLDSIVHNIMLQFEVKALEKNLSFSSFIDPKINKAFCSDAVRLAQILTNLISNSIKFTNEGEVFLRCELVQENESSQRIKFIVSDTGIGIEESKQDVIFESFIQENSTINRKYGGTGLGLSISKQLVGLLGGELIVNSQKDVGSSFSFEIELKKAELEELDTVADEIIDNSGLQGCSVLLVEDNKLNQYLATIILEQLEIKVTVANNGDEAIELLLDNDFDLILMDLQMPFLDGLSATKIIRKKMKDSTPIIALTANAILGDREKCIEAGMDDYISKPFNKKELASKILRLIKTNKKQKTLTTNILNATFSMENIYNLQKLKEQTFGNDDFVKKMVELFCEVASETTSNMEKALLENNKVLIKSYAHKIKPSIDALEVNELKTIVREIETYPDTKAPEFLEKVAVFTKRLNEIQALIREKEL